MKRTTDGKPHKVIHRLFYALIYFLIFVYIICNKSLFNISCKCMLMLSYG